MKRLGLIQFKAQRGLVSNCIADTCYFADYITHQVLALMLPFSTTAKHYNSPARTFIARFGCQEVMARPGFLDFTLNYRNSTGNAPVLSVENSSVLNRFANYFGYYATWYHSRVRTVL